MSENIKKTSFSVPRNADKILFADDFVNYSLTQFTLPTLTSSLESYRTMIHNAFNQTVIVAANCLYKRLEKENHAEFENLRMNQPLDRNTFINYVTSVETEFLSCGFDAQKLLHFCVKTITMALKFYGSGFIEGPALAAKCIAEALESFDMNSGGWDRVNAIAENYAKIYADVDKPSDSESEHESTTSSSSGESSETSDSSKTPSKVNGQNCTRSASRERVYTSSDLSEVSSFEDMCLDDEENKDIQTVDPCLELNGKAASSVSYDAETPSENEAKPEDDPGSASSNSVYYDTDEDWDSDIFEGIVNEELLFNRAERRVAKKRPASSSSTSESHVQSSPEKSDSQLTSLSTTNSVYNEDSSLMAAACNEETSDVEVSPARKHNAKRRNF